VEDVIHRDDHRQVTLVVNEGQPSEVAVPQQELALCGVQFLQGRGHSLMPLCSMSGLDPAASYPRRNLHMASPGTDGRNTSQVKQARLHKLGKL
jgi:hypothetical protein